MKADEFLESLDGVDSATLDGDELEVTMSVGIDEHLTQSLRHGDWEHLGITDQVPSHVTRRFRR